MSPLHFRLMVAHEIGLSLESAASDVAPSYPVFDRVVVSSRLIQLHKPKPAADSIRKL